MLPKTKRRVSFRRAQETPDVVLDVSKFQNTERDPDKIVFEEFAEVINMDQKGKNAEVRRGTVTLAQVLDLLGIAIYEYSQENKLVAAKRTPGDPTKTDLVEIDRSTGVETDLLTAISGADGPSFTSLNGWLHMVNGTTDIIQYEAAGPNDSTLAVPGAQARLISNDESRIWIVDDSEPEQLLRASVVSTGRPTSFDPTGIAIGRGIIANSKITKYTALQGVGKYMVASSSNRTEIHAVPDFALNGLNEFPQDVTTVVHVLESIGTDSQFGIVPVDSENFILKGSDEVLYMINVVSGQVTPYRRNLQQMGKLDFSQTAVGYDQRYKLSYISGKKNTFNDKTVVFNTDEKIFATYTDIFPKMWAGDNANMYYMQSFDDKIIDAFPKNLYQDNEVPIRWSIKSAKSYAKSIDFWKIAQKVFLNIRAFEDINILYEFVSNERIGGRKDADFSFSIFISGSADVTMTTLPWFGLGLWGAAGYDSETEQSGEHLDEDTRIRKRFIRGHIKLSGLSSNRFSMRGMGFISDITTTPVIQHDFV